MSSTPPSAIGGVSTTIGPLVRSTKDMVYTVSALAVRNRDLLSISSEKMTTELSSAPMLSIPCRMAYSDAPW
jgi:hypothetical protein